MPANNPSIPWMSFRGLKSATTAASQKCEPGFSALDKAVVTPDRQMIRGLDTVELQPFDTSIELLHSLLTLRGLSARTLGTVAALTSSPSFMWSGREKNFIDPHLLLLASVGGAP